MRAVDERGLRDESLVVFTADHGELLYRDNALFPWSHDFQLAPEVLRAPLLIRGPGVAPGRAEWVTRSIDLYPTIYKGKDLQPRIYSMPQLTYASDHPQRITPAIRIAIEIVD